MRETLVEFLKSQSGYYPQARMLGNGTIECLMRPDGTIAAEYKKDEEKWRTHPTQEEMVLYEQMCGRGFPSKLATTDLTNPGSIKGQSSASNRAFHDYF